MAGKELMNKLYELCGTRAAAARRLADAASNAADQEEKFLSLARGTDVAKLAEFVGKDVTRRSADEFGAALAWWEECNAAMEKYAEDNGVDMEGA